MGGQTGGARNSFSDIMIPYEGLINENYFKLISRETELINNLEYFTGRSKNPYNKKYENFIGLLLKSKYDGVKQEDQTNIKIGPMDYAIALDISGSMMSALEVNDKNGIPRIELAKKALLTMIDNLKDGNQMSITTFNHESQLIIPLSPKSEILMLKEKIKNINPDGGTKLTNALKGAYETLKKSKKKFKRVIIITDGWVNEPDFMNTAINVTNNGVGISVIAIDKSSNSKLFEQFSKLGGCNYFIATKDEDLEKYLIHQFTYLTFIASYNIKLNFESDDCEIIKAIGTNSDDNKNINNLCNIPSCFPSDLKFIGDEVYQEGGLILLKIKLKNENIGNKIKINLKLEYTDNDDKNYIQNYPIEYEINEGEYYSNNYLKKGIALYYYGKIRRKIAKFFNSDTKFTTAGPVLASVDKTKYDRYFNFLRRDNENIDKVKKYFNQNYFNDIVENQKENYIKILDEKYELFLKKRKEIEDKVVEKPKV
jgi:uncharacterized protein YegL